MRFSKPKKYHIFNSRLVLTDTGNVSSSVHGDTDTNHGVPKKKSAVGGTRNEQCN